MAQVRLNAIQRLPVENATPMVAQVLNACVTWSPCGVQSNTTKTTCAMVASTPMPHRALGAEENERRCRVWAWREPGNRERVGRTKEGQVKRKEDGHCTRTPGNNTRSHLCNISPNIAAAPEGTEGRCCAATQAETQTSARILARPMLLSSWVGTLPVWFA